MAGVGRSCEDSVELGGHGAAGRQGGQRAFEPDVERRGVDAPGQVPQLDDGLLGPPVGVVHQLAYLVEVEVLAVGQLLLGHARAAWPGPPAGPGCRRGGPARSGAAWPPRRRRSGPGPAPASAPGRSWRPGPTGPASAAGRARPRPGRPRERRASRMTPERKMATPWTKPTSRWSRTPAGTGLGAARRRGAVPVPGRRPGRRGRRRRRTRRLNADRMPTKASGTLRTT